MSPVKVFISYAREDTSLAYKLYNSLKEAGISPWLDSEALLPGQNWRVHIKRAIESSDYFIALFSSKSVDKRGYVQKELKYALDLLDEFPESEIFVVPVRLEECLPAHEKIKDLHWVDLFPSFEAGVNKILRVVLTNSDTQSHEVKNASDFLKNVGEQAEPKLAGASPTAASSPNLALGSKNNLPPMLQESNTISPASTAFIKPPQKTNLLLWFGVGLIALIFVSALIAFWMKNGSLSENSRSTNSLAESNTDPIKVGVYLDLSGQTSSFGQSTLKGIKMAADEINKTGGIDGRRVEILVEDDQGNPPQGAAAVDKLINQYKVHAVLGGVSSSVSLVAAPRAQAAKIPMIAPCVMHPQLTQLRDYIFRVCFIDPVQGSVMARFARNSLGAKTAGVLLDQNSDYSQSLAKAFEETFGKLGGQIVAKEIYALRDATFSAQLTNIRSANPDVLFVPGYYAEVGLIAKQARQLNIKAHLLGGDSWDTPQLWDFGGDALNGSYMVSQYSVNNPDDTSQRFVSDYKLRYGGERPDIFAAHSYDAMYILREAIERAGTTEGQKLRNSIAQTRDFPGVTGDITFDSQRNPIKTALVLELQRGQFLYKETIKPR